MGWKKNKTRHIREEDLDDQNYYDESRGVLAYGDVVPSRQFDPIKNTHLWTMWRLAVNERILNETKIRSQNNDRKGYSFSLTRAPLSQYIKVTGTTRRLAHTMMVPEHVDKKGILLTGQFIYYGIPRITVKGGAITAEAPNWTKLYGNPQDQIKFL